MKRIALAIALAVAGCLAAVASLGAHAASTSSPPCTPKKATLSGKTALYLCGPATAALRVGGKTYTFRNGYCEISKSGTGQLELFLGVLVPTLKSNAGKPLFSVLVDKLGGEVSATYAGKQLVNGGFTSPTGHLPNRGAFKTSTAKITGNWNCHGVIYNRALYKP